MPERRRQTYIEGPASKPEPRGKNRFKIAGTDRKTHFDEKCGAAETKTSRMPCNDRRTRVTDGADVVEKMEPGVDLPHMNAAVGIDIEMPY